MLEEAKALISHAIGGKIKLRVKVASDIWQATADPTQLQSALLNLAVNARDAMPDGGKIRIYADNRRADRPDHPNELAGIDAVAITLADAGVGMSPEVLQRVMEPFFTTKGIGKGTGLGLAMVHGFIQQSGGALRIESRVGQGTIFTLFLPRGGSGAAVKTSSSNDLEDHRELPEFRAVLVVDDDASLRGIIAEGLRDRGYMAHEVADADAALKALDTHAIDAVVTDVNMPDVDGIALVRQIRANRPEMPCLFVTAQNDRRHLEDEAVLEKPFTPAALSHALVELLVAQDRRMARQARFDRLEGRMLSTCALSLFRQWRDALVVGSVPPFKSFDLDACHEPHRIVVAEVELGKVPIEFHIAVIGDSLRAWAGESPLATDIAVGGNDNLASREAAYRRCALTGRPSFEYARMDLDDGQIETFERLLLPYSTDGQNVDRIVGAIVIASNAKEDLP